MKPLALGVIEDLRQRRLVPVALVLLLALVAVPVLMLKPAAAPTPQPTPGAVSANPAGAEGLPSPAEALKGDKPLVSLAVLAAPSNLGSFDSRNPFKPLKTLASVGATPAQGLGGVPAGGGSGGGGGGSIPAPAGGGSGTTGGGGGGGAPTGGGSPDAGTPPAQQPSPAQPQKRLTYAVDVTLEGPNGTHRYHNVPRLSVLPSQSNPLFIFLGVEDNGTDAVFLVDATLHTLSGGAAEGTCAPDDNNCSTLRIEPGQRHSFVDDSGTRWTIQIGEVREVSVASAARAARAIRRSRAGKANAAVGPTRRFVPPVITDLFTASSGGAGR